MFSPHGTQRAQIGWEVPTFLRDPLDEPSVSVVDNAYLSRVEHGNLRTYDRPTRYHRGAVYDADGRLVVSSQKIGGLNGHPWVPADKGRIKPRRNVSRLTGTWLYGGHWMQHFGHFLIEQITTMWHTEPGIQGLVFHQYLRRPTVFEPWMLEVLDLLGFGGLPIEVIDKRSEVMVDRLVVPSRTVVANGWGHPQARAVWERLAEPFRTLGAPTGSAGRVFFSRTEFNESRRRAGHNRARSTLVRDEAQDAAFAAGGFQIVAPENLGIDQQLRFAANASVLAGNSGSALHLSAFAPTGTRVLEVGDERNPTAPLAMQRIIDRLGGHPHRFLGAELSRDQLAEEIASSP